MHGDLCCGFAPFQPAGPPADIPHMLPWRRCIPRAMRRSAITDSPRPPGGWPCRFA